MKQNWLFTLALLLFFSSCSDQKTFYISTHGDDGNPGSKLKPWASPEHAQIEVRDWINANPSRDVKVVLSAGTYFLQHTLTFSGSDGGGINQSVTWEANAGDTVILSGGQKLTGWIIDSDGKWRLQLPAGVTFEQLYINGERAIQARFPNADDASPRWYIKNIEPFRTEPNHILDKLIIHLMPTDHPGPSVQGCEAVIFKDWATLRHKVLSYNAEQRTLLLKPPFALFEGSYNSLFAPYVNRFSGYLEGNPAFIDQPGEWAIDHETQTLMYMPLAGQTPENIEVIAPLISTLLSLKGIRESPVSNLTFKNIRFEHAAYMLPSFGHDGRQACFYYSGNTGIADEKALIDQAVLLEWANNCTFEGCVIELTGANGIFMSEGTHNNVFRKGQITDFGGNGIMIGLARDPGKDSIALPSGNCIENSKIYHGGRHYESAVGIWLGFTAATEIKSNEVFDLPYTGISVGWQWNPLPTSSRNNLIEDNEIHHVMQMLGDGGGIYTLGYQPGSVIRGNNIWNVMRSELNHASPNNGMFIDEGSKGYLIENNTISRTAHTCIRGHRAAGVTLKNNTFMYEDLPAVSHTPPYNNMIFVNQDTTVTWLNPGWPAEWGYGDTVEAFYMEGNIFKHL